MCTISRPFGGEFAGQEEALCVLQFCFVESTAAEPTQIERSLRGRAEDFEQEAPQQFLIRSHVSQALSFSFSLERMPGGGPPHRGSRC